MILDAPRLQAAVVRINAAMPDIAVELNQADAGLGDGDAGNMLARLMDGLARSEAAGQDLPGLLATYARAAMASTGSSLGTLVATALSASSRTASGKSEVAGPADIAALLVAARDAMLKRGGALPNYGLTVIDAIDAVATALASANGTQSGTAVAAAAAAGALTEFRGRPCRIGRARMFGDKSIGLDDPGMLAVARLTAVLASEPDENSN